MLLPVEITMKPLYPPFLALATLLFTWPALAEEYKENDRHYIQFGAFLIGDTSTFFSAEKSGLGGLIDTNEVLDLDTSVTVGRIDGYWRYHRNHRLEYALYDIKREGSKVINQDLEWNGEKFAVGSRVDSLLRTTTAKVNYSWSFYRNEKVELGIGGGLHVTRIKAALSGTIYVDPNDPNNPATEEVGAEEVNLTAPLPVVGFRLSYNINNHLRITGGTDIFALRFSDIKGNYRDTKVGLDWRLSKHLGLGGSLINSDLYIETKDDHDTQLKLKNTVTGAEVFVSLYF
jgi:hypothetical protein